MHFSEERSEPCSAAPAFANAYYHSTNDAVDNSLETHVASSLVASGSLKRLSLETVLTQSDLQRLLRILAAPSP